MRDGVIDAEYRAACREEVLRHVAQLVQLLLYTVDGDM
jgi:hypothetical protein